MKKTLPSILITLLLTTAVHAQQFYYRLGLGYDAPLAGSMDGDGNHFSGSVAYTTHNDTVIDQRNYKIKKVSFASGLSGAVAGGYMFNKNLGIELGANIGIASQEYTFVENNIWRYNSSAQEIAKFRAELPVLLIPSLVIQAGEGKINFYSRMGIVLPVYSRIAIDATFRSEPNGSYLVEEFNNEYKTQFSVGISAAAGLKYKITPRLSLFGEFNVLSMSLYAKENDVKKYTANGYSSINGVSLISQLTYQHVYYSNNTNVTTGDPTHQLSFSMPFSSIGIHAGIFCNID